MTTKLTTVLACTALAALLSACASKTSAPVVERSAGGSGAAPVTSVTPKPAAPAASGPESYTVKRGDTLYGIALDHGQDYRDLAAWNNIANVNLIQVGQVLRVVPPAAGAATTAGGESGVVVRPITAPGGEAPAPTAAATPGGLKTEPNGAKRPYSEDALAQAQKEASRTGAAPAVVAVAGAKPADKPADKPAVDKPASDRPAAEADDVAWAWPASGKLIGNFSEGGSNKGLDIAAKVGEPVLAAGPGKVVYSGQGLRGYGRLIIIKHNSTYLSAYAHNSNLLVKEGQAVTKGQKIAEAGNTDSDVPKLHFEIRRQGKPVDPIKYLPEQR